jgi:glyoxylase I family protein
MFKGLEHIAIASPDPEKLAQWYVDHLDFAVNYRYGGNVFVKAPNGAMLEIIPAAGERAPETMKDPGLRHLAIAVDDFDAACERLRSQGIQFLTEPLNLQGNRLIFFADGDGNFLHLIFRATPLP